MTITWRQNNVQRKRDWFLSFLQPDSWNSLNQRNCCKYDHAMVTNATTIITFTTTTTTKTKRMQKFHARACKTQSNQYLCITKQIMLCYAMLCSAFKFIGNRSKSLATLHKLPRRKRQTIMYSHAKKKTKSKEKRIMCVRRQAGRQSRSNANKCIPVCDVFSMLCRH